MDFTYSEGGSYEGKYYPALRDMSQAIVRQNDLVGGQFIVYEPGNATRYDVLFATFNTGYEAMFCITLVNFGRSMVFSGPFSMVALGYMEEKLGLNRGDCYALIPLINAYLDSVI